MAFRKPLQMRQDSNGQMWAAYFRHPLRGKPVRIPLGLAQSAAQTALDWLNKIFLDKAAWRERPASVPLEMWKLWTGDDRAVAPPDESESVDLAHRLQGQADFWKTEYYKLFEKYVAQTKELEHWKGRKVRTGPCPSLQSALASWIKAYKGRDSDWTKIVTNDLKRFVAEFKPVLEVDELAGRERDIDAWLRSLSIGAGRRQQMRRIIIRFLDDSGVALDKDAIAKVGKDDVRKDRGAIRWLERKQADAMAKSLPSPWCDYFRVQVALGVRPDELTTMHRSNFHGDDFKVLTLSPIAHLTLKRGSRTIKVPEAIRDILKRRFAETKILFPDPATGELWADPKSFNRFYRKALDKAGKAAGIAFKCDCRIPRRTCASLLLRSGTSVEEVAALLGDDPKTIREHYAAILSHEVDSSAAALDSTIPEETSNEIEKGE